MLSAFFESIKYVGHVFPIAFLRIYLGYYWFHQSLTEYHSGLFTSQVFADELKASSFINSFPSWYRWIFENLVFPYWSLVSHGVLCAAFAVGISLIIGFLVRPLCILGIIMSLHFIWYGLQENTYAVFVAIFITLIAVGAGRCVGFDYYFYKRNRGIWW